ncbi:MAG: type II toxin-antitoxin system Phd/YefM family antitoxin [Actinomycetota bacterium]|jgi:prevent-host-death family protein|nr:type II toxin-antitoxin system Phd/YefM family antitoxin [Actinomycetota bacterium]
MKILPLSQMKARLSEIAEEVATTHKRVQITKSGREHVVLLAAEDLESVEATLELLADPDTQDRLRAADADIAAGEVLDERAVRDLVSRHRHEQPR